MKQSLNIFGVLITLIILFPLCKKDKFILPELTTSLATNITASSAISGGTVIKDGGTEVTERGICYGQSSLPSTIDNKVVSGSGTGTFSSNMSNLNPGTRYYVRAYAINRVGIIYGNEVTFITNSVLSSITTTVVTNITANSASSGGNITNDGGSPITERGICYSTSINPTTSSPRIISGSGIGSFTSNITGLIPGMTYYLRAYAINSIGTAYGNEVSFTTNVTLATITTTVPTLIAATSAISGGNITNDGGSTITIRGVCWNTSSNPTIANNKTVDGSGTGSFTSSLTSLNANTTYYARAYAINSAGTAYGNEVSFTTLQLSATEVTICSQVWMVKNLDVTTYRNGDPIPQVTDPSQWANLTTGAWCYYNNDPAIGADYGKLYNLYAVTDPRGLAPVGWHIPTDTEWETLYTCLGGDTLVAEKMKEVGTTHWKSNAYIDATNSSGFTALPGGRRAVDGQFYNLSECGFWWSSSEVINTEFYWVRSLCTGWDDNANLNKGTGLSVRCLRD